MTALLKIRFYAVLLMFFTAIGSVQAANQITEEEAYEIGKEAFVYFYPLVTMDLSRQIFTNVPEGKRPSLGPANKFHHTREFPSAEFREVVRPNFDTLYSSAWLDLTKGPVIVSAPNTNGRYYLLPMLDMWTNVFAVPGSRTSGTEAHKWLVTPKGWTGKVPAGMTQIEAPTPHVWIIGRTQTNGPSDYAAVNKIQDGFTVELLNKQASEPFKFNDKLDMKTPPLIQVNTMPGARYLAYAAEIMKVNPPHDTDWSQIERLKRIGIEVGKSYDLSAQPKAVQQGVARAVPDALKLMKAHTNKMSKITNGWLASTDTMGVYGNHYLKRAIIAQIGLGANQPEDAIYPLNVEDADGEPMVGGKNYVIHFSKDELPPVDAFWSLTMYDEQGFQVANELNRFAIGDRDKLQFNKDGSLDIYIQPKNPGNGKEANWLPSPASGRLGLTLRLYAPKAEALNGVWNAPAVQKAK